MIPNKTVQEILETAKVEEVIDDFVSLKRRGVNLIGLCPFHNEKSPSFTVSPSKNLFKCFGCGKGGGAVNFIMEHDQLTYPDALRYLARKYNIEIEEKQLSVEEIQERQLEDSLYLVNQFAQEYYQHELLETDRGKSIGLSYFKGRSFGDETIKKFGLGYAPASHDQFTKDATTTGYALDHLKQLGLTAESGRDFFRDRVMFPIHSVAGKIIAFAGRIMVTDPRAPKYINSPETDIYHKSNVLYGMYFAKASVRKKDECLLVEGYTDVISLVQAGIENVVASSGTSLTNGQISLIKRFTPNIKILYDGDAAGIKAALRGLELVLEADMNVRVVLLPNGEDPDSYVKKVGAAAFETYIDEQSKDFILFKTDLLLGEAGDDPVKKAGLVHDIVDSIALVPDPVKRSFYLKQCAQLLDVEDTILVAEMNKAVQRRMDKARKDAEREQRQRQRQQANDVPFPDEYPLESVDVDYEEIVEVQESKTSRKPVGDEFQEKDIARIILAGSNKPYGKSDISIARFVLSEIEDVLEYFDNSVYNQIVKEAYQLVKDNKELSSQSFINHEDEIIADAALNLLFEPFEMSDGWLEKGIYLTQALPEDNFTKDSTSAVRMFKLKKLARICQENQEKLKSPDTDEQELIAILQVHTKLLQMRDTLMRDLRMVVLKGI